MRILWDHDRSKNGDLWGLLPFVIVGMAPAILVLRVISNDLLRPVLGGIVLVLLGLEVLRRRYGWSNAPHTWWFAATMGFLAGFATTTGNVAGPVMSVYLISRGLPKEGFMGTAAWYFFIVNVAKVPFFCWLGMITMETVRFDLWAAPFVVVGALIGVRVLPIIPQRVFNTVVLMLAALVALKLVVA